MCLFVVLRINTEIENFLEVKDIDTVRENTLSKLLNEKRRKI